MLVDFLIRTRALPVEFFEPILILVFILSHDKICVAVVVEN